MTTATVATVPRSEEQRLLLDLPNGAPDVTSGRDRIVPNRITIRYSQHEAYAVTRLIEVHVRGNYRDPDGTVSPLGDSVEVWSTVPRDERPAWIGDLVKDNLPAWWTA
jgi:hypothetical protein